MKLNPDINAHLTYCSNIHAGESWEDVSHNLERYALDVKKRLAPNDMFGIGLRLSAGAASTLADDKTRQAFKQFLQDNDLYVFTLNGFPYGDFHGQPVKEDVYLPDWRDPERLDYTNTLADILADILANRVPEDLEGSISTVPGAFKALIKCESDIIEMAKNMIRHVAHLVDIQQRTGKTIVLALEPEPCCFIETTDESVAFFNDYLFADWACQYLMHLADINQQTAEAALRRHLGICLDLCHAAVEFESPKTTIDTFKSAGIKIAKLQISAGLRLSPITAESIELLRPFEDDIYLHQTVAKSNDRLTRHADLHHAFAAFVSDGSDDEWRVHFHVPIFLDDLGLFSTTQDFIRETLKLHQIEPISAHLEVETYSWNVLPEKYRDTDIVSAIVRELNWVQQQLTEERV